MSNEIKPFIYATMKVLSLDPVIVEVTCEKKGKKYLGNVEKEPYEAVFTARRLDPETGNEKNTKTFGVSESLLINEPFILEDAMRWSVNGYHCLIDSRGKGQKKLIKKLFA